MNQPPPSDKDNFLSPRSRYYGNFTPENLVFNANLQEFANRVMIICSLETAGKLPPEEAYKQIRDLWEQLQRSKIQLDIGTDPEGDSDTGSGDRS